MKTFQKPLSKEEESLCIQALQAEDAGRKSEAKRLLIERNLRLVAHIAKKYNSEEELEANSGIIPAVNQIECHPLCYPKELIDYCQDKGIQVQAYAPLARGAYLDNDVMCVLGTKYAHTPAQIGLRWATQKGISVIPKSVHPDRIRSNGNIFDFTIEQEDMDLIDTLNENFHSSHIPEDLRDISF